MATVPVLLWLAPFAIAQSAEERGRMIAVEAHDIARDEGPCVLLVTHDPRVEDVAYRILWLEDGALRDRKPEPHEWVRDPVCEMRVDAWTATLFREYEGAFCSE